MKPRQTRVRLRSRLRLAPLLMAPLLLAGCSAPRVHTSHADPDFSIAAVKGSKLTVAASPRVIVMEFKASYESVFGSGHVLARHLENAIAASLATGGVSVTADSTLEFLEGNTLDPDEIEKGRAHLRSLDSRYVLYVKNIIISNRQDTYASNPAYGTPGAGAMSIERCVVTFDVDVWDRAAFKKKSSFNVSGSASVTLFAYQTALKGAINKAVGNLKDYIVHNKK